MYNVYSIYLVLFLFFLKGVDFFYKIVNNISVTMWKTQNDRMYSFSVVVT